MDFDRKGQVPDKPGVYKLSCGEYFYIGMTEVSLNHRLIQHRNYLNAGTHHNTWVQRSANKYGVVAEVLLVCEPELAVEVEAKLIDQNWGDPNLMNLERPDGTGSKRMSEETCRRLSDIMRTKASCVEVRCESTGEWVTFDCQKALAEAMGMSGPVPVNKVATGDRPIPHTWPYDAIRYEGATYEREHNCWALVGGEWKPFGSIRSMALHFGMPPQTLDAQSKGKYSMMPDHPCEAIRNKDGEEFFRPRPYGALVDGEWLEGPTLKILAEKLGKTRPNLSNVFRGAKPVPKSWKVEALRNREGVTCAPGGRFKAKE